MGENNKYESLAIIAFGMCVIYFLIPTPIVLGIACIVAFAALIGPIAKLIDIGWFQLGHGAGWVNSRILLTVLFFIILTPLAWIYRMTGKDPLKLKKPSGNSNFVDRDHEFTEKDLKNPW